MSFDHDYIDREFNNEPYESTSPTSVKVEETTVYFNWIENKITFLCARLGPFKVNSGNAFFFDPTPGFYGFIAQGTTDALNEAMKMLANHLQISSCPVIENWDERDGPLVTSDYDWTKDTKPPGMIKYKGAGRSRISLNITNKHSHYVMGAILAHELTHYYLFNNKIVLDDNDENEKFTDLATVFLGLGKLTINGYEPIKWEFIRSVSTVRYEYRVGYLNTKDIANVMAAVISLRHINASHVSSNLIIESESKLRYSVSKYSNYKKIKESIDKLKCLICGKEFWFTNSDELVCSNCGLGWNQGINKYRRGKLLNPKSWFRKDDILEQYKEIVW